MRCIPGIPGTRRGHRQELAGGFGPKAISVEDGLPLATSIKDDGLPGWLRKPVPVRRLAGSNLDSEAIQRRAFMLDGPHLGWVGVRGKSVDGLGFAVLS